MGEGTGRRRLALAAGFAAALCMAPSCEGDAAGVPRATAPPPAVPDAAASDPAPGCGASSLEEVNVFLEGAYDPTTAVRGSVSLARPATRTTPGRYTVREPGGKTWTLAYGGTPSTLPVDAKAVYDIRVDYRMGEPSPCGILIRDERGVAFAAASDHGIGDRIFEDGVPGFEMELVESGCPNRSESACFESVTNQRLRVTHDGATKTLSPGETATLGGYEVTCITAQEAVYSNKCADAALFTVSYSIRRVEERRP